MLGLHGWELLIVAGVILLLFGNRLPTLMRSLGRGVVEFKKGVQGIEDEGGTGAEGLNRGSERDSATVDSGRRA